jgi:two-component system, LuxR family, response regulator FixJ
MGQQIFASARPVVVIVDDDLAVRSSLAFSLETEGIAVLAYVSGAELLLEVPDAGCFVIDYKLPGMNGLDLLAELRRRKVAAPAILITTHPSAAVRERAVATGTALIEKPLLGDALFREIRAALAG